MLACAAAAAAADADVDVVAAVAGGLPLPLPLGKDSACLFELPPTPPSPPPPPLPSSPPTPPPPPAAAAVIAKLPSESAAPCLLAKTHTALSMAESSEERHSLACSKHVEKSCTHSC